MEGLGADHLVVTEVGEQGFLTRLRSGVSLPSVPS
jgi:hypothetical protein